MTIIDLTPDRAALWNDFVDTHSGGWFWHRYEWIEYCLAYTPGSANRSFLVLHPNGVVAAIVPLIQYGETCNFGGESCPIPLTQSMAAVQMMPRMLAEVIAKYEIKQIAFRSSPLAAYSSQLLIDYLEEFGFVRHGFDSQVIDLTQSEAALHAGIRKSYTSLANKTKGEMIAGYQPTLCRHLQTLHCKAAGRTTRPFGTWDLMADWATSRHNFIVLHNRSAADYDAGACFYLYKKAAYYACGANLEPNRMHAVIWAAMQFLKMEGIESLEMGWLDRPGDSEKDKNISFFKRGFGGGPVPLLTMSWEL